VIVYVLPFVLALAMQWFRIRFWLGFTVSCTFVTLKLMSVFVPSSAESTVVSVLYCYMKSVTVDNVNKN